MSFDVFVLALTFARSFREVNEAGSAVIIRSGSIIGLLLHDGENIVNLTYVSVKLTFTYELKGVLYFG